MTEATNPAPSSPGIWEDFIDIFMNPSAVFERRRDGKFGMALLALILISTILFFALRNGLAPMMDAEMAKQAAAIAAKNPSITPDQIAAQQGMAEKFAVFGVVIFTPIVVVATAVILWIAAKFIGAGVAFAAAMMISTYAQFPRIIDTIVGAIQGLLLPPESITGMHSVQLGPARFLGPDANPFILALLGSLNVFTIWVIVLLAIGLSVVAKVPRSRAAVAALVVWVVGLLPGLYQSLSRS